MKISLLRCCLLLVLFLFSEVLKAWSVPNASFSLNHFSSFNKMPGESVQCIYEDHLGLLWIGIESTGLVKYDGKNYTIYQNDPENGQSISSNYPTKIFEDAQNTLWIATPNGLNKLDRNTGVFHRYQFAADDAFSLSSNGINDILPDGQGRLWLATTNGVSVYVPEEDRFYRFLHNRDADNPAANNDVGDLHRDNDGNIWVGTSLHGLFRIKPEIYQPSPGSWACSINDFDVMGCKSVDCWDNKVNKEFNSIRHITSGTNSDTIWLACQSGLFLFVPGKGEFKQYLFGKGQQELNMCTFQSLLIDRENKLWAGSSNNGLVVIDLFNTSSYHHLNAAHSSIHHLASNAIREIYESRSGLVWICTKFGGLHYYDKRQNTFALLRAGNEDNTGLSDDFVLSVLEDSKGRIWIGTKGGGLNCYNRVTGQVTVFGPSPIDGSLQSNRIECLAEDDQGILWIGSSTGVWSTSVASPGIFKQHSTLHSRNFYIEDNRWLWIGTSNGLFRFSIKEKKLIPVKTKHKEFFDLETNIGICRVLKDRDGILWIATSASGLFEYNARLDKLTHHTANSKQTGSISGNQIRALYIDKKGRFWIGAKSDGLNLFEPTTRTFKTVSSPHQLPSNSIYNIVEDDAGQLWMGTHSGIACFSPETGQFINFGPHYGLQSLIYDINAYAKTADGHILMGGSGGLNLFDPATIRLQFYMAPLIVSKLEVFNQVKAIDISTFKSFTLDYNNNYISFEFALLDFTNPEKNCYTYQLEPFDKVWINAGNRNYATYTNLTPGIYRFKVKGANSDEMWTPEPFEMEIVIPAPIWKQVWFWPGLLVVLLVLLFFSWFLKNNSAKRREHQLRAQVDARTKDLYEAYKKLEESNRKIEQHNAILSSQRDRITGQNKELMAHRQNLEELVVKRTQDLAQALQKAEESDRLKSAFLANMSHEIRTPLNAIMGFVDLLEADEFDAEERARINGIIQTNSNALLQLINDIIDISMIEANQLVINKQKVDFHRFLSELELHYRNNKSMKDKNLELVCQTPDNAVKLMIETDYGRVWQVFCNLINNAIKFTHKGSISFGYTIPCDEPHRVRCFVADTGIGISSENQQKLFQRFRKIEPEDTKMYRGTGLGLSISRNLIELLGGYIWVESELQKGSVFYFTLPLEVTAEE